MIYLSWPYWKYEGLARVTYLWREITWLIFDTQREWGGPEVAFSSSRSHISQVLESNRSWLNPTQKGGIQRQVCHAADSQGDHLEHRWRARRWLGEAVFAITVNPSHALNHQRRPAELWDMNKTNESVFQKSRAQDDKGLEEDAKSLLVRILDVSCLSTAHLYLEREDRDPWNRIFQRENLRFKYCPGSPDTRGRGRRRHPLARCRGQHWYTFNGPQIREWPENSRSEWWTYWSRVSKRITATFPSPRDLMPGASKDTEWRNNWIPSIPRC